MRADCRQRGERQPRAGAVAPARPAARRHAPEPAAAGASRAPPHRRRTHVNRSAQGDDAKPGVLTSQQTLPYLGLNPTTGQHVDHNVGNAAHCDACALMLTWHSAAQNNLKSILGAPPIGPKPPSEAKPATAPKPPPAHGELRSQVTLPYLAVDAATGQHGGHNVRARRVADAPLVTVVVRPNRTN